MAKSQKSRQKAALHALVLAFFCCFAGPARSQSVTTVQGPALGTITGTVVDQNGNFVVSALVNLVREGSPLQVASDKDGHFVLQGVTPGPFELNVIAEGFAPQQRTGLLHPGESLNLFDVALPVASATTEVQVHVTKSEIAEEQIKVQETQRVLGVIPNFYVTYNPDALPLSPRQKFELAWKTSIDPVTFAASAAIAGVEQANNSYRGYGQGTEGYSKRFGASFADSFVGVMVGGAILPTLLKQDPRYFYKGTGSKRSRVFYALANAVVCKGDNGRWQPDYSGILGSLASGGISNLYYPASSRNGAWLTFENTFIGIGGSGIGNIFQEFVVRKLTPHSRGNP
jgi:Carboxypeptidase regulatory-like domain